MISEMAPRKEHNENNTNRRPVKERLGWKKQRYDSSTSKNSSRRTERGQVRSEIHRRDERLERSESNQCTKCRCNKEQSKHRKSVPEMWVTIPILTCYQKVTAKVDTGRQLTRIGRAFWRMAKQNGSVEKDIPMRSTSKSKVMKMIVIPMGIRSNRMKRIECIVDEALPERAIVLGMRAIKSLEYKMWVGRNQTVHKEITSNEETPEQHSGDEVEDDVQSMDLSLLDEQEQREIEKMGR